MCRKYARGSSPNDAVRVDHLRIPQRSAGYDEFTFLDLNGSRMPLSKSMSLAEAQASDRSPTNLTDRCNVNTNLKLRSAALLAGALISLGAMAQTPDSDVEVVTKTVKFDRAEASTPAGASNLYQSLNQAAAHVCVDHYASAALQSESYAQCRDAALAKAVDQVDISALTALYQGDRSRKGTVTFGQG